MSIQKELNAAETPEFITKAEAKQRIDAFHETVESGLDSFQESADLAKETFTGPCVANFYSIIQELIGKLKKGIPTMAKELEMILDYLSTQVVGKKGVVDQYMRDFVKHLECDEKGNDAHDPKSGTLLTSALYKRVHKRDFDVFFRLGRKQKVWLRETQGFDADGIWTAMSKKLKGVICMYIEDLYDEARKYVTLSKFYDEGHWKDIFRRVSGSIGPDLDKALADKEDGDMIDPKTLSQIMFKGIHGRINGTGSASGTTCKPGCNHGHGKGSGGSGGSSLGMGNIMKAAMAQMKAFGLNDPVVEEAADLIEKASKQ